MQYKRGEFEFERERESRREFGCMRESLSVCSVEGIDTLGARVREKQKGGLTLYTIHNIAAAAAAAAAVGI